MSLGNFDWENEISITLPGGAVRTLPWISGAQTAIPDFILKDYKKENGWELLYNLATNTTDIGSNYLIFYNKFYGKVRVFYYLNDNISVGNAGFWGLGLTGTSSLLNTNDHFTSPDDTKKTTPTSISNNIIKTGFGINKIITRGWNVFETEFTYTEDNIDNILMNIISYNTNTSLINITGNIDLLSEGTIVTTTKSSG
ncbi:hypothetical protein [Myroides odoratimimus]|uniref:hypothetical protein n=1 Tax=Myroides odoratimimus TaxID=76832 RepID=UPI000467F35A|nr:hypothetical protein [Myroides odoratimimus]